MPKTYTAQSILNIGPIFFLVEDGVLKELNVTVEVNYGELGLSETIDILPHLTTPDEVGKAEALYKAIEREVNRLYLG